MSCISKTPVPGLTRDLTFATCSGRADLLLPAGLKAPDQVRGERDLTQ